jgi:histidinol-phosphate aminotransferase
MVPYRLGEQPTDRAYIKLNSNETSVPASPLVLKAIREAAQQPVGYYSDQDATVLRVALGKCYHVNPNQVLVGNGADEILSFCFGAYGENGGFAFPDITYGFFKTFMNAFGVDYLEIPLREDFTIDLEPYKRTKRNIVIANPNAPTGLLLPVGQIAELLESNSDRIVIIDEAYLGFGSTSCIDLVRDHRNLIVVHTMSKARNLAGLHVGYAIASAEMIEELSCLKNCFNPNNLNQVTLNAAVAAVEDQAYTDACCAARILIRDRTIAELSRLGFHVIPSHTNFVLFTHPELDAVALEEKLRDHGILVRHYGQARIQNYIRMTIGTQAEMDQVISSLKKILSVAA